MDPVAGIGTQTTATNSINPLLLFGLTSVGDISPLTGGSNVNAVSGLGLLGTGLTASSQVELSGLGLLVSALDSFQSQAAAVQQAATPSSGAVPGFAQIAAAAQQLADTFNNVQNTATALNNGPLGPFVTLPVATQLSNQLNNAAQTRFNTGPAGVNTLAAIGITLQAVPAAATSAATFASVPTAVAAPANPAAGASSLKVDLNVLQAAYQRNAAGVASVLSRAAQGFNGLAANYVGANGSLTRLVSNLQQNVLAADLFTVGNVSAAGSLFLALNTLPSTRLSAQQANAIRQYAQVASMALVSEFESNVLSGI